MTRQELEARLESLEYSRFLVDMIDRWLPKDWERARELDHEISEVRTALKALAV